MPRTTIGVLFFACIEICAAIAFAADDTQHSALSTESPAKLPSPAATTAQSSVAPNPSSLTPNPYSGLEMTRPMSPEESLKAMHVRPGMKIELVAAEPLIVDPVAFDWGPDGRLWVVEMRDYPSGITWKKEGDEFGKPGGRIKVLTDTDGDGRYDKAAIFLDEIPFPTGVKFWRKGILVTAAPEIFYAEDKDGDDKADERIVLYRGFGEGNQQHRVNGLRWGLDGWLYVGNGDSGGVIRSLTGGLAAKKKETGASEQETGKEVNVAGRDLRIRPDSGEIEATSGSTQFGRERDDWGNWFGGNNSDPLWHYTLDDHYLRRNPHTTYPPVRKQVSIAPGAAPVFPRSQTLKRFNDDNKANRYTSACSPMLYRDELLGAEFYGNSFVCEPVHNLVAREIVEPKGTTFSSHRAADEQKSEFLASEDSWFRPSMCRTGPDGAVWVADMYRFVIEHPKWIPAAAQAKLEIRAGDDKGRIYRIYPEGKQPRPIARLDKLDTAGLVAALDSPNGPQRDLAQQVLLWRGERASVPLLRKLVTGATRPQVRLQALSTLEGLRADAGDQEWTSLLVAPLADQHPGVRRQAVRLAEPEIAQSPELQDSVLKLAADADPQVRMQVAYSLGAFSDRRAAASLAQLLAAPDQDSYLAAAAMSSLNKENIAVVLAEVLQSKTSSRSATLLEQLLATAVAMGSNVGIREAMDAALLSQPGPVELWQLALTARFLEEMERRKTDISSLVGGNAAESLKRILIDAKALALGEDAQRSSDLALRTAAIRVLGHDREHVNDDAALLQSLITPKQPAAIQSAAIAALGKLRRSDSAAALLAGWVGYTPAARNQILDLLASREDWSLALLSAVASGQISPSQFDARRRQQFVTAKSKAVRERAEQVLAASVDSNRQRLIETYLPSAAAKAGDSARGKLVFANRCANCHKLDNAGHAVGPDLAPLTHKSTEYLLTAILDPNRAIEDRYIEYVAQTTDGRQLAGMLLEETGASLTLAAPEGKRLVLPRGEIEQLKSSGKSLMPEGIEKDVTPAEMADLVAYLKAAAPPPKQLALNQPEVVQPFNDGSIRLFASNCRAYGPTIKMEEAYRALGWWNSQDDHCAWSFDVPAGAAGEYRVTLEYSCADDAAGNTAVIESGGQTLTGTVATSGGWDKYRGWTIGTLKLAEGRGELLIRSSGPIKGALFDLGGVRLVPVK